MALKSKDKTPIGHIKLTDGVKAIYPMNDLFLMHMFSNPDNWEALKLTANLIIDAYKQKKPTSKLKPIEGSVNVITQYKYLLSTDGKTTKDQDIKAIEVSGSATYLEFQNRARINTPIEIRSVEYFGLGIGHSKGKLANQIWLLADDVDSVLHGNAFARYILKDEITDRDHPTASGIMYVSLIKLSNEQSPAGELASFLLGKITSPKDEAVAKIVNVFNASFIEFRDDKEVFRMLSLRDRGWYEGKDDTIERLEELQKDGYSFVDAMRIVREESAPAEVAHAD